MHQQASVPAPSCVFTGTVYSNDQLLDCGCNSSVLKLPLKCLSGVKLWKCHWHDDCPKVVHASFFVCAKGFCMLLVQEWSMSVFKHNHVNHMKRYLQGHTLKQGSKLRPFWSHILPKCNLCDSKIYLGAFVRVQIIAVVRPLQFSAKRSRITAQHVPRDRELKQVKLFIRALV